jgi:hypothetical protein
MIKYVDSFGRVIAQSDSPIKFNLELFPTFAKLKKVVVEKKTKKKLDSDDPKGE